MGLPALLALVLTACAVMEPPPGGPEDKVRPHLEIMVPDSASTGLGPNLETINLTFSEKMDRVSGVTWLHFFPDQRIRRTKWHGARRAEVALEFPLPADTVIIVEIAAGMRDAHKVKNRRGRRYPIATGDSIPTGRISGVLVMADSAVTNGVVELYDVPPDTLEYFQQNMLRRTVTDNTGAYRFDWLPESGGPWLMRAFADANGDLRPGDNEAQRLLPDTLSLAPPLTDAVAGVTTLFDVKTPGRLLVTGADSIGYNAPLVTWTMVITDSDTGWVPAPNPTPDVNYSQLDSLGSGIVTEVRPGANRLVLFVDVDRDSTFSGIADSLLGDLPDSVRLADGDSVITHFLEPWLLLEGIEVLPGLDSDLEIVGHEFTLTPWVQPEVQVDSLQLDLPAAADTTTVTPDQAE